jgi:hypothetical protein
MAVAYIPNANAMRPEKNLNRKIVLTIIPGLNGSGRNF